MKAVVINRQDRPERLAFAQEQFKRYGIEIEIFSAIINSSGWKGCRDSHLAVFEKYRDERYLMVYEDDCLFLTDPVPPTQEIFKELPKDWDALYFGISPQEPYERVSEHLFKVKKGYCTHAILWNNKKDGIIDYILAHKSEILKIDIFFSFVLSKLFNMYVIYPCLCVQTDKFNSDTCKRSDTNVLLKNYNKFCI